MTIGIQNPVSFACDGTTKVFPIPIQAYAAADIAVVLTAPGVGGAEIMLLLNSDYSMAAAGTLQPTAWVLTTLAASAYGVGYTLQAFINPVQQQQTQFVQGQAFPSLAVQTAFDRLTQMVQRLQYQVSRSMRAPDGDVAPIMLLPVASLRSNKVFLTDSLGNPYMGDAASIATIAAFGTAVADTFTATAGQTVFALSQNPGALANLDVSLDGATLVPTLDYTWSGTTLTLLNGALVGQKLLARYMQGLPTGISQAAPYYIQTPSEITAGVVPPNLNRVPDCELDIRRYGYVADNATDNAAAITNAIAVLSVLGGGTIVFPSGIGVVASTINCDSKYAIRFRGMGGRVVGGHNNGTTLKYTGTGAANFINMRSAYGCVIEDMQLTFSNAGFTGYLVDWSHATSNDGAYNLLNRCQLGSFNGLLINGNGVNLDKAIICAIRSCTFSGMGAAILGQAAGGGSYSNVIDIDDCSFDNIVSVPIQYCGEAWNVQGCSFEPRIGGICGALFTTVNTPVKGLNFIGNWMGDITAGSSTWVTVYGQAVNIEANRFGGNASSNAISLNNVSGWSIKANSFNTFSVAIAFDTSLNSIGSEQDNYFTSVTNKYSGLGNTDSFSQGAKAHTSLPNEFFMQGGVAVITVGTPLAVVFPKQFPNALTSLVFSLSSPSGTGNTTSDSARSTSGFTGNVYGAAGANNVNWQAFGY